jgi:glutathione peroxidase-family protein
MLVSSRAGPELHGCRLLAPAAAAALIAAAAGPAMALRRLVTGTMASRSLRRHCFAPPALGALVASGIGAGVLLASVQPQHSSPMLMSSAAAAAASTAAATRLGDFQAVTATGATVSLAEPPYSTRVALVVNVASEWGLTDTNYRELQQLQARHGTEEEGRFTVLAWPCNQFGSQEPRAAAEVQQWAATKYGVTFPIFSKVRHYAENGSQRKNEIWAPALLCDQVQVNGPEADAIWVWLKEQRPAAGLEGFLGNDIKWNFVRAGLVSSTSSTNSSCLLARGDHWLPRAGKVSACGRPPRRTVRPNRAMLVVRWCFCDSSACIRRWDARTHCISPARICRYAPTTGPKSIEADIIKYLEPAN